MHEIGEKIYNRRKELGLTLEEVGNAVGVGRSTVQRWESGMIKNMGRDKIAKLAKILQISPVEIVPGDGEKTQHEKMYPQAEDIDRLEALHQNPRLGILFDHTRKMAPEDVEFMLQMAERMIKERDANE